MNVLNEVLIDSFADAVANRVYEMMQAKPPVEKMLLTAAEVGVMIERTERAVTSMHYNGQIEGGFIIGGKLRFDKRKILAQIDRLLEDQRKQ